MLTTNTKKINDNIIVNDFAAAIAAAAELINGNNDCRCDYNASNGVMIVSSSTEITAIIILPLFLKLRELA